jgi:serine/threonine protein kinase
VCVCVSCFLLFCKFTHTHTHTHTHTQQFHHPHVVNMLAMYETSTKLYMVLELLAAGDLFNKILQKGCFSERACKRIVTQITEAVAGMCVCVCVCVLNQTVAVVCLSHVVVVAHQSLIQRCMQWESFIVT